MGDDGFLMRGVYFVNPEACTVYLAFFDLALPLLAFVGRCDQFQPAASMFPPRHGGWRAASTSGTPFIDMGCYEHQGIVLNKAMALLLRSFSESDGFDAWEGFSR